MVRNFIGYRLKLVKTTLITFTLTQLKRAIKAMQRVVQRVQTLWQLVRMQPLLLQVASQLVMKQKRLQLKAVLPLAKTQMHPITMQQPLVVTPLQTELTQLL